MRRSYGLVAVAIALSLTAAACGDDDEDAAPTSEAPGDSSVPETEAPSTEAPVTEAPPDSAVDATEPAVVDAVCPANLVIQTDWWPEAEHGGTYNLIGPDGIADKDNFTYSGPIQAAYAVGGIETVEVRAGGDAISFAPVSAEMKGDTDITLGYINSDDIVKDFAETPAIAVMKTLEINPQMLMFDPESYPDLTFETIKDTGAPVLYFDGAAYMDYLIAQGWVDASQADASYGGAPERWLESGGKVIQQGFITNEVYKYENDIEGWKKPVETLLIHDSGYQPYPAALAVSADRLEELSPCLEVLVPAMQQAWVDYISDPVAMNNTLIDINTTYDTYWTLSEGLNAAAMELFASTGIGADGPAGDYGSFDEERLAALFEILKANPEIEIPEGVTVTDTFTNEFIDPAIALP